MRGFTLLELLTVVAIMSVVMVIGVAGFIDIGRGAGIKSTALNLRASVSHARQYAITKRTQTYFLYGNTNWAAGKSGYYLFATNRGTSGTTNFSVVGITNYTAGGILFGTEDSPPSILPGAPAPIVFDTDGSCVKDGSWPNGVTQIKRLIVLTEAKRDGVVRLGGLVTTTEVYRLTGRVKGGGWVNE